MAGFAVTESVVAATVFEMILPESERGGLGIEEEEERRLDSEPLLQGTGAGEQLEPVYDRFG